MTPDRSSDFDVGALYTALDAERRARGLSWQQLAREINGAGAVRPSAVASSTLRGLRAKRAVEGDGVLQMLRWLGRTPESFVPGSADGTPVPRVAADKILRFDTRAIYAALDAQRNQRGMTWMQVAREIGGLNAASLTRFAKGGRTAFPQVMRIARWLDRPAAGLTHAVSW